MTSHNSGRLAIHRRSDEISFLQDRLQVLETALQDRRPNRGASFDERDLCIEISERERDLADEFLHTRQIEPLGETLQRRLAMAERICRDLRRSEAEDRDCSQAYRLAKIERQALAEMLKQWWGWLQGS